MARNGGNYDIKSVIIFAVTLAAITSLKIHGVNGDPEVPCFFIFGDSLSDNGNNNVLLTTAKVNYMPYGIDFPGGVATGRFNNGPTTVDVIAKLMGFADFIPPFTTAIGNAILNGVNYASGAAGIRDETGQQMGIVLSMNRQLRNHRITVSRINNILGSEEAGKNYLKKCIYHLGMGNNDYINNYFLPQYYPTSRFFTPEQFAQALVNQYEDQIKRLYDMGARKVALAGVGLIGCTPNAISMYDRNGSFCVEKLNNASQLFNDKLVDLVDQLNSEYSDAQFIYINYVGIGSGDPTAAGFTVLDTPCCPVDKYGQCVGNSTPCPNRNTYVFWDNFHPTAIVNNFTAIRSYSALLPSDTYPFDIKRLAQLQLS